jgi:hypothetical protein
MAFTGQVLYNPVSGERFVFHTTAVDSAGRLLEFEVVVEPHGRVPGLGERYRRYHQIPGESATGQPGDASHWVPPSRHPGPVRPGAGRASGTHPSPARPGSSRPIPARPGAAALTARQRAAGIGGKSE